MTWQQKTGLSFFLNQTAESQPEWYSAKWPSEELPFHALPKLCASKILPCIFAWSSGADASWVPFLKLCGIQPADQAGAVGLPCSFPRVAVAYGHLKAVGQASQASKGRGQVHWLAEKYLDLNHPVEKYLDLNHPEEYLDLIHPVEEYLDLFHPVEEAYCGMHCTLFFLFKRPLIYVHSVEECVIGLH